MHCDKKAEQCTFGPRRLGANNTYRRPVARVDRLEEKYRSTFAEAYFLSRHFEDMNPAVLEENYGSGFVVPLMI